MTLQELRQTFPPGVPVRVIETGERAHINRHFPPMCDDCAPTVGLSTDNGAYLGRFLATEIERLP